MNSLTKAILWILFIFFCSQIFTYLFRDFDNSYLFAFTPKVEQQEPKVLSFYGKLDAISSYVIPYLVSAYFGLKFIKRTNLSISISLLMILAIVMALSEEYSLIIILFLLVGSVWLWQFYSRIKIE